MRIPRFVVAGVQSGVGKTTVTLGLMKLLREKGFSVQPYKVGPDYIDPGLHEKVCGVPSHNLDSWMGSVEEIKYVFCKYGSGKDIAVIEGVMGLYDGARGERERGSTAHIAKITGSPVILVVDARGMARSCAALIKGYMDYDRDVNIKGVFLNNVGSINHVKILREIIEGELKIPVVGFLSRGKNIRIEERHLGLLPAVENKGFQSTVKDISELVANGIDLEKLLLIARNAPDITFTDTTKHKQVLKRVRVGVALDEAFNFYYRDGIEYLKELGAEICYFSPLEDERVPSVHGLYIGGGFPEMFLDKLAANTRLKRSLRSAYKSGMPIYAECGGYMYLTEEIRNFKGERFPAAGIIPARSVMTGKLAALGYVKASSLMDSVIAAKGDTIRGHEFHWSEMEGLREESAAYRVVGTKGKRRRTEGYCNKNLLASYVHLHFRWNPGCAERFLEKCANFAAGGVPDVCG